MATWLFKDGQKQLFEADRVQNQVKNGGWSFDDPDAPAIRHPETVFPSEFKPETLTASERHDAMLTLLGIQKRPVSPIQVVTGPKPEVRQKRTYTRRKSA